MYSLGCLQHNLVKSLVKNFMKWCYTFMTVDRRVVLIEPVLIYGLDSLHCVTNFVMNGVMSVLTMLYFLVIASTSIKARRSYEVYIDSWRWCWT